MAGPLVTTGVFQGGALKFTGLGTRGTPLDARNAAVKALEHGTCGVFGGGTSWKSMGLLEDQDQSPSGDM